MSMRWQQKYARGATLAVMVFLLVGCSGGDNTDLQAYINEVKASTKGRITPLPEFVPVESFAYSANDYGDPFMSWETKAMLAAKDRKQADNSEGGLQPDLGRRRESLEAFPLDTLRMVGTMSKGGKSSALVSSPDGLVSRIVVGNYLGQNYGQVTSVAEDKIELIEVVPDGLGAWIQRPASLAVAE